MSDRDICTRKKFPFAWPVDKSNYRFTKVGGHSLITPPKINTPNLIGVEHPAMARSVREFLSYCRIECGFAPATLSAYAADLRDLWQWMVQKGFTQWDMLNHDRIADHLKSLSDNGLSTRSIARHVASIRVYTRFLFTHEHVLTDAGELLSQPAIGRPLPDYLNREKMETLLTAPQKGDALYQRDIAILELLYAGGLRATEMADLEIDSIQSELQVARVMGKGSKERIVPLGNPAMKATQVYLDELRPHLVRPDRLSNRLLLSRTGNPITRIVVWQIVTKYAQRVGLTNVHPHTLRHTFATHLLAGGADLRVVQELLGHASIRTTQIYTHVDASKLKSVIHQFHPRP